MKRILLLSLALSASIISAQPLSRILSNPRIALFQNVPPYNRHGFDQYKMKTNGEQLIISELIKDGDIVFDIGANVGKWTQIILDNTHAQKIYSFEPIPDAFEELKQATRDENVSAHNIAISNQDETKTFFLYDKNAKTKRMSSFHKRAPHIEKRLKLNARPINVKALTLDTFCKQHKIPYIDFLKIDTEGHELAVLEGAANMLKQNKISIIQFEYGGTYQDAGTRLKTVYNLLSSNGYQIFRIVPRGLVSIPTWHPSLENYLYSNYLAISPY